MKRFNEKSKAGVARGLLCVLAGALSVAIASPDGGAHHSFAMFDTRTTVSLTGTVTSFEWTNPHAYIELDVTEDDDSVRHWTVELGSPSILQQSGWKFNDIKTGETISVTINPLRDGQPGGLLGRVTLPDGRELGNGPGR